MNDIAIKVEGLGKKYKIGRKKSDDLRESLTNLFKKSTSSPRFTQSPNHQPSPPLAGKADDFWALKDIDFEIKHGEAVGIIGRNGAGKSTLLKILSRITKPTTGRIEISGRVSSLLEVGTGFHPELTGRQNIFLNGTILGMKRLEIKKKFDEIVAFSGVENFIDTPVKHYSSGMKVRLAFSVAAHLEPEILIIDEVLAVGDAEFQKKCLGKMEDVAGEGRTVLFVSHNMEAVRKLCSRALLLDSGKIKLSSSNVSEVINSYYSNGYLETTAFYKGDGSKNDYLYIAEAKLINEDNVVIKGSLSGNSQIFLSLKGYVKKEDPTLEIGYHLRNESGIHLYSSYHHDLDIEKWPKLIKGSFEIRTQIPVEFLNLGKYYIEIIAGLRLKQVFYSSRKEEVVLSFSITGNLSNSPYWTKDRKSILAPRLSWDNIR